MGDEIIKVLEYLNNSNLVKDMLIGYAIFGAIILILAICVFVITIKTIVNNRKEMNKYFRK